MPPLLPLLLAIFAFHPSQAADPTLKPAWNETLAESFVQLSLQCVEQPLPNYWERFEGKIDPRERHPAFFGCYDWHSAVHGHWAMIRAWKMFPHMPSAKRIEEALSRHLTKEKIEGEVKFLRTKEPFENPYGYGWFFRLMEELESFEHPKAKEWRALLQPIADLFLERYPKSLERLNRPYRVGTHDNTAFTMIHLLDYADRSGQKDLRTLVVGKAREFFLSDTSCPTAYEPGPYDFISPCLVEADLMRRVLPRTEFLRWEKAFFSPLRASSAIFQPVVPKDIKDPYLGHQIGLMFQKAASMRALASALPARSSHKRWLARSADLHAEKGLSLMFESGYGGTHWLASFAIFHFSNANLPSNGSSKESPRSPH